MEKRETCTFLRARPSPCVDTRPEAVFNHPMPMVLPHSVSRFPSTRILLRLLCAAMLLLSVPVRASAASVSPSRPRPSAAIQPAAPLHIVSVDSALLPPKRTFSLGPAYDSFPGKPAPADTASRRFTVRWYANPQFSSSAVLLLEFATPSSRGVIRSRTHRLDPKATGFQSATFDVPFSNAVYWRASILSSGRLLSRLQSPNWYEIRDR